MKTDLDQTCNGIAQSVDTGLSASQKMALGWERPHRLERETGERPPMGEHSHGLQCLACIAQWQLEVEFLCYVLLAELPRTDTVGMDRRGPRATGRTGTLMGFREAWGTLPAELYLSIPYQLLPVGMRHRDKAAGEKGDRGRTGMREQGAAQPNLEKYACWRLGGEGRLARSVLTMAQGTGT